MPDISYRFVTAADPLFPQAQRLRWDILRAPLGIPYQADMDDLEPGKQHLVAVVDGHVVGYGCVIVRPDGAQIRHMAVEESMRGKGVGRTIALKLMDRAKQAGSKTIWVMARFTALEFWHKLGFTDVGAFFNSEETALPHKRVEYHV